MKRLIVFLLFTQLLARPAWSQENGNDLHEWCSDTSNSIRFACQSFINGYFSGVRSVGKFSNNYTPIFCIPDEVRLGQVVDIIKKNLRDFPEIRHHQTDVVITLILSKNFPCKSKF